MALNGQEALDLLATYCTSPDAPACPALIFLDVNMPVMNGFEFLTAYHPLPLAQQDAVVIIMLTTSLHPCDGQRAQELPEAGFLNKPLTAEKVAQVLQQHFDHSAPTTWARTGGLPAQAKPSPSVILS